MTAPIIVSVRETEGRSAKELAGFGPGTITNGDSSPGSVHGGNRITVTVTSGVALPGGDVVGSLALPKPSGVIFRAAATQSCRLRLYRTAAERDAPAEIARAYLSDPATLAWAYVADYGLTNAIARTQRGYVPFVTADDSGAATGLLYYRLTSWMLQATAIGVTLALVPYGES